MSLKHRIDRLTCLLPTNNPEQALVDSLTDDQLRIMISLAGKMQAWQEGGAEPELTEEEWELVPLLEEATQDS